MAAPSSPPERRGTSPIGINPIGITLVVALVVLLSLGLFMCTQRGGTVEQNPGAFGPSVPERITTEEAERIGPPNPPDREVPLGPSPADFAPGDADAPQPPPARPAPASPAPPAPDDGAPTAPTPEGPDRLR
ncbi:MAG: hypothetical protein ACK41D_02685 [Rubricoccaceae bacterium]